MNFLRKMKVILSATVFLGLVAGSVQSAEDFSERSLKSSDFSFLDLTWAHFYGSDLTNSTFYGAKLYAAKFHGAILKNVDFRKADVRRADFTSADLSTALFDEDVFFNGSSIDSKTKLPLEWGEDAGLRWVEASRRGMLPVRE